MHQFKNTFLYTVIFTFVLCFLFVLVLSFTNAATVDLIKANVEFEQQQAILKALGAENVDTKEQVNKLFKNVEDVEINGNTYYKANFSGSTVYATRYSGPGLWGAIKGYISIDENLTKIMGFQVTDQNETPGLGARIGEQWFLDQLNGEAMVNDTIVMTKSGTGDTDKNNGKIDGITGATRTSEGIQAILNESIKQFKKDLGEGR